METLCSAEEGAPGLADRGAGSHVPGPRRSELWGRGISEKLCCCASAERHPSYQNEESTNFNNVKVELLVHVSVPRQSARVGFVPATHASGTVHLVALLSPGAAESSIGLEGDRSLRAWMEISPARPGSGRCPERGHGAVSDRKVNWKMQSSCEPRGEH